MIFILVDMPLSTSASCEGFGHCIEKSQRLSCCLTQIFRVCVFIAFPN